jgi:prepilin-type N-terminal cleavage/methylation domain-containing protein
MRINEKGFTLLEVLVSVAITVVILVGLYNIIDDSQKMSRAQQMVSRMNAEARSAMELISRSVRSAGNRPAAFSGVPGVYVAEENKIRLLADLPQDFNSDGDTFDITDGSDADTTIGNDDNEDENSDEFLNDDEEDVTYQLSTGPCPCDLQKIEFSTSPDLTSETTINGWTAVADKDVTNVIARNILGLEFEYFQDSNTPITAPVTGSDRFLINIVKVKVVAQTSERDRKTGLFHTTELVNEIDIRNK